MNITDIQKCAKFYRDEYLKKYYLVTTYNGNSFVLIGEDSNFPHLMGIAAGVCKANGFMNKKKLFRTILDGQPISTKIIPNNISSKSKMYEKAINFNKSINSLWNSNGALAINYKPIVLNKKLNSVDVLITDINSGYMLGWIFNSLVPLKGNIGIKKYCVSTWIDESSGSVKKREKYMPNQEVEPIRYIFEFDEHSELLNTKEYIYNIDQKKHILEACERNNSNLLIDERNRHFYLDIVKKEGIHCKINGVQY